jgi:ubiquinone biosynthesis monooxygenase Coq7
MAIAISARLNRGETLGGRVMKVNHAGEHGAVNIYAGQIVIARWTAPDLVSELSEFRTHEMRHRAIFAAELRRRGLRRCRSYVLCGIGGYVLGIVTGLLGRQAIAATTAAVETVVLRHLDQQLASLQSNDVAAAAAVQAIITEEREHHDRAAAQVKRRGIISAIVTPVVAFSTEAVIWLGMHL